MNMIFRNLENRVHRVDARTDERIVRFFFKTGLTR
jgi:hypothetical protein